jgi:hypothetical protein
MPPSNVEPIDLEQLSAAEERWTTCPLSACKRDTALLYEDFYLRDIRTNRIMCSQCAVRTEIGYIAQEVVKRSDDRFFQATTRDYLITAGVMLVASVLVSFIMFQIRFLLIAILIGGSAGVTSARFVRRLTDRRIGRQSALIAAGSAIAGLLVANTLVLLSSPLGMVLFMNPLILFQYTLSNPSAALCILLMAGSAYGVFKRRI